MKIATYNVWNHEATLGIRIGAITEEIARMDPDIIALQEVPGLKECQQVASKYNLALIGNSPATTRQVFPSDHYGVLAELRFDC